MQTRPPRWIAATRDEAARSTAALPWERGARRSESIARRNGRDSWSMSSPAGSGGL